MGFPLLQKPGDMCVDKQIKVLGSYWKERMSNEEENSLYLCTVRDYHVFHKWDTGGTPSQAMELQEMGVDGQGNRETGGSTSDRIFFMKYPMPFLQHWYGTFPPALQDTTTTGTSDVSPPSVGVHTDMTGESSSGDTQSKFPDLPPSKDVVFKYWTLNVYPMTSSLMVEILDNTQPHSSATLRWLVRSVGLNEASYTAKTRLCLLPT